MDCSIVSSIDEMKFLFLRADPKWLEPCCYDFEEHREQGFLIGHCLRLILVEICQRGNDTSHLLKCSKVLCRFSATLSEFSVPLHQNDFLQLVDFCFYLLDFPFADAVGFQAVSILKNLLEIHRIYCHDNVNSSSKHSLCYKRNGSTLCDFLLSFGRNIIGEANEKNSSITKQRAMALTCLLHLHPELRQLIISDGFVINVYKWIENEPPTVQICNLLVDDIRASLISRKADCDGKEGQKNRLNLHLTWIKTLFISENIHSRSRQALENKLLPALLRSPETRNWFFAEFPMLINFSRTSTHSRRALCVLLRLAIVHLYEIQNGSEGWKELLAKSIGVERADKDMYDALMDRDFETRLTAWSLLCFHPKGSQPVSCTELEFAREFMSSGVMNLSTPAARQAVFCQFSKLISRIREHSKSLIKSLKCDDKENTQLNEYLSFLRWLSNFAFEMISDSDWHRTLMESLTTNTEKTKVRKNDVDSSLRMETNGIEENEYIEEENDQDEGYEKNDEENKIPFSTRISALTLLSILFTPFNDSDGQDSFLCRRMKHWIGSEEQQKLIESLDDQFEACQKIALNLLNNFESLGWLQTSRSQISSEEWLFLHTIPNMPRHQQAIKYRLYFLLPKMKFMAKLNFIEKLLEMAEESCTRAAQKNEGISQHILTELLESPQLHATLNALKVSLPYVEINNNYLLIKRIHSLCILVDKIVSPVVHSLSPEGFMPCLNDASLSIEDYNIYAQQLSRTCFRAHKSISGIFSHIFSQYLTSPLALSIFGDDLNQFISQIAHFFWQQLTECRHRGAFEAASNEFSMVVCPRLWTLYTEECQQENVKIIFPYNPRQWLSQILAVLTGKDDNQRLCVTRRSAGLPHLFVALLENAPSTELKDEKGLFHQTMKQLLACNERQNSELEVHCINVLRLLFMHSKFSELVLPHVECAFKITINGSSSEIWPVRNAYMQLFAALVKRIFGTPAVERRTLHIEPRCKQTANEFFKRYPLLYKFLLMQIAYVSEGFTYKNNSRKQFGCKQLFLSFPLIVTLTHLRPNLPSSDNSHYSLQPFLPNLLILLLFIPAYSIKALASAAILSISTDSELEHILNWFVLQTKIYAKSPLDVGQNFIVSVQLLLLHMNELKINNGESFSKLSDWINSQRRFLNFE